MAGSLGRRILTVVLLVALGALAAFLVWGDLPPRLLTLDTPILYLSWDQGERIQLYRTTAGNGQPRQLTEATKGLLDYAPAPDGNSIAYSSLGPEGASDVWLMDGDGGDQRTLVECGSDSCSGVVWAPDGQRLVYERRPVEAPGWEPGPPRLWWFDLQTEETTPLFSEENLAGMAARFSPGGRWLAFVVSTEGVIQLYDFEKQRSLRVPSETGQPAAWHPTRHSLLFTELQYEGEAFGAHIFGLDLSGGEPVDLSAARAISDSAPAWSPAGEWIAFGRKPWRASVGRQLWLMRADGSDKRALTNDLESNFGPPSWSADGEQLLFQRFQVSEPSSKPSVWLMEVQSQELRQVADPGFAPAWLP